MENEKPKTEPPVIDYKVVIADLEKKRDDLDRAIAVLKLTALGYPQGIPATPAASDTPPPAPGVPQGISEHTFFGMSIAKAAETYLLIKKKPASALEMAGALVDGGFPSQSDNFGSTITTALYRQKDTFVRVKRGMWGLKVWYPNYRKPD